MGCFCPPVAAEAATLFAHVPAPGVSGPAWFGFGRDAQHSAQGAIATQDLNRIAWSTPVDLAPQYSAGGSLLIHYGSPVVTSNNTVVVPVKTGAAGGFRFDARSGVNGGLIWSGSSDYVLPAHNWTPSYNLALDANNRLFAPGAGGKLFVRNNADSATGALQTAVFFGAAAYAAAPATYDATIFINTPLTVDANGNVFFGFIATGPNPAGLFSGIARIGANGVGSWVPAAVAAGDFSISKVAMNSAPALSPDLSTLYVAVNTAPGQVQTGYLLALDAATLAVKARAPLFDPGSAGGTVRARVSDDSTASPTVGPDGKVYFGVLENSFGSHNARGWLLQFNALLAPLGPPGGFGWDDTASIVPASMVASVRRRLGLSADGQVQQLPRRRQRRRRQPHRSDRSEREPDRCDLGPADHARGAQHRRRHVRARQHHCGEGVVHQQRRCRPGHEFDPRQQRRWLSLPLEPELEHLHAADTAHQRYRRGVHTDCDRCRRRGVCGEQWGPVLDRALARLRTKHQAFEISENVRRLF